MVRVALPKQRVVFAQAQVWKRIVAFVIDLVVLDVFLFAPFNAYFSAHFSQLPSWGEEFVPPAEFTVVLLSLGVVALLYFALLQYYLGATLGMRLFGLQVSGERSFWQCLVRNAFIIPVFPFWFLWFIEPFYLFARKERLLERWSGTGTVEMVVV